MQAFEPCLYYKCPGPHHGPPRTTYDYRGAKTEDEAALLLEDGWFPSLAEAVADFKKPKLAAAPAPDLPPAPADTLASEEAQATRGRKGK